MTEAIRQCGTCYACCVALGIAELRKHAGATCRHLDGRDPERRCTIYERRPVACSGYRCAWLVGLFGTGEPMHGNGFIVGKAVGGGLTSAKVPVGEVAAHVTWLRRCGDHYHKVGG